MDIFVSRPGRIPLLNRKNIFVRLKLSYSIGVVYIAAGYQKFNPSRDPNSRMSRDETRFYFRI